MITLSELCKELNNWFDQKRYFGLFTIQNGELNTAKCPIAKGQFFRIAGSVFNDGVYRYPVSGLKDEVFDGAVWAMAVPKEIVDLLAEINEWVEKYANNAQVNGPFTSESFGGYSYTKAGNSTGDANDPTTWMGHFRGRLNRWRKIR